MTDFARALRTSFSQLAEGPIRPLREKAFARFAELGLPTTQDEEWRTTSLAPLLRLELFSNAETEIRGVEEKWALGGTQLVFVNGGHRPELSSGTAFAGSLRDALAAGPVPLELARHAGWQQDAMVALNTAFIEDGAFIEVPAGAVVDGPIHLLFISTRGALSQPRNLIVLGANAQATVVETWIGEEGYLTNSVAEVVLGEGARLDHYKLQVESARAFHLARLQVRQGRESHFSSHSFALGAALARNDLRALFAGEGSECALNGLYLATGKQHLDNRTLVDHQSPRCTSRELYKGILDGQSRGVFSGRVLVEKDAQKTNASQTNKNLVLSDDALVNTKPQLEIFADDVKCAHGAAVGRLDEDALFYLRSRGIGLEEARSLLTYAFASEMVELIPLEPLRARVRELVTSRLP